MNTKTKIACARTASMAIRGLRRLFGCPEEALFQRSGIQWKLNLREGIDFSIYLLGAFEPETVRAYQKIIKSGDIVLDIGANVGAHVLPLAKCVGPTGRIAAFEPTDYAFEKLCRNVSLNPELAPRIELNQSLLADELDFAAPESIASSWPLTGETEGLHAVHLGKPQSLAGAQVTTLDAWFGKSGLDRVNLIKLDVDGHEIEVLRGGRQLLTRFHPPIVMEYTPYIFEEQGHSFGELLELIADYGYLAEDLLTHKKLPTVESAIRKLIPPSGSINVLLRHSP